MIGVMLLILGLGSVYEYLSPRLTVSRASLAKAQAQLQGVETDIQVLTTAKNQLDKAKADMENQVNVDFSRVPLVFPVYEDIPGLYLQYEALMQQAGKDGLQNASYQITAPTIDATDNTVHIPVTVSAVGKYSEVKQFILDLERNLRPLSISTVNLAQTLNATTGVPDGKFTVNVAGVIRAESLSKAYATNN